MVSDVCCPLLPGLDARRSVQGPVTGRGDTPPRSVVLIDRHYDHLARDGRHHAINLPDQFTQFEFADVHAVDASWTFTPSD